MQERLTNNRPVITFIAIAMTTVAGVAFGYVGEWGRGEEPTTRNLIVLGVWIFLVVVLTVSQLLAWSRNLQIALAALLLIFIFGLFATYRHQQMGNLGDSPLWLQIASYQSSYGAPPLISLSSMLGFPLNQALYDIGFKELWAVPFILGLVLATMVILAPRLLGSSVRMRNWFPTAVLLFISGSFLLYFFRTYMEFYTFPALALSVGILLSISILSKRNASAARAFIAGLFVGVAPTLHTLFVPFSGLVAVWLLATLILQHKNRLKAFVYWLGLITPMTLILLVTATTTMSFFLGNFGSANAQGLDLVSPHLFELAHLQERALIATVSLPVIFLILFLIAFQNRPSSTIFTLHNDGPIFGMAFLLTLFWLSLLLAYNPAGGSIRERDFMLAPTVPLLAFVIAFSVKSEKLASKFLNYGLLFSCVVTATVVSSYIEPTFDTGAIVQLITPWRS